MSDSSKSPESLDARQNRSSVMRRVVMPLLVVIIAGAVLIWGRQSEESDLRDVEEAVRTLCEEVYRSPAGGPLPNSARQMGVRSSLVDLIHQVFDDHDWDQVRLHVQSGDTPAPFGDGRATHHAIIYISHQQRLGLRLVHRGGPDQVEVLGYWIPDPNTTP
jgi:hypothetical protein